MSNIEFSKEELERYSRHLIIPDFNIKGQRKLKGSKVLLVGTGGLGSPLLLYLTAAGVGTIGILDFDVIKWEQYLSSEDDENQINIIRSNTKQGRPVGTAKFIEEIGAKVGRVLKTIPRGRPRKKKATETD